MAEEVQYSVRWSLHRSRDRNGRNQVECDFQESEETRGKFDCEENKTEKHQVSRGTGKFGMWWEAGKLIIGSQEPFR